MRMTTKQLKILTCLIEKNPDETDLDLDQLLEKLITTYGWETTKASMQFSLRRLIGYGVIEKLEREVRREKRRAVLRVTSLGHQVMGR